MAFFDLDGASTTSRRSSHGHKRSSTTKSSHSRKGSRSRSRSPHRKHPGLAAFMFGSDAVHRPNANKSTSSFSLFGGGDKDKEDRHRSSRNRSSASFSTFGADRDHRGHNRSTSSFFGLGNGHSRSGFFGFGRSPSYYKRSPRPSFIDKAMKQVKRLMRDLVYYAKRHPLKVFMLVIMPLITGGALTALLARFGIRLPASIERMLGVAARAGTGDSIGLVGEAVRMASGAAGGYGGAVRGLGGSMPREGGHAGPDGGWGGNIMGWAKTFI